MRFIGNKTQLLDNIKEVVDRHAPDATSFCDIFSGTASVSRFFKQWYEIYSNDLLYFSYCLQKGTIENPCKPSFELLSKATGIKDPIRFFNEMPTESMESLPKEKRFFQNNYSPIGGRMYITDSNALRIDYSRNTIEDWYNCSLLTDDEYFYLVACVVEGVPFVSNIAGTYGAFNKKWDVRSNKLFIKCVFYSLRKDCMEYLSIKQTSEKWGISVRRIQVLCSEGRIPGATKIGSYWAIPADAEKPSDERIKSGKYIKEK